MRRRRDRHEPDDDIGVQLDRPDPVRGRYPRGPGGWHYGGLGYRPEPAGGREGVPRRPPKNYQRSSTRVREDVCEALTQDGFVDATDIEVDVERGVVFLRGFVTDRASKRRAETVAERVLGVEDVMNELRLPRPRPEDKPKTVGRSNGEQRR